MTSMTLLASPALPCSHARLPKLGSLHPATRSLPALPRRQSSILRVRAQAGDGGEAFVEKFKSLSGEALSQLSGTASASGSGSGGCCGGSGGSHQEGAGASGQQAQGSSGGSGGGCGGGCGGVRSTEEVAAQGVIQAFGALLGDGTERVTRQDLEAAFSTPLGEGGSSGSGERFWDLREVLEGAPEDLVFEDDGLDAMVV